jgi:hypothetical protein
VPHILLTGAGFSRNWGGWLADEAFEYLLGHPLIDDGLRTVLWRSKDTGGFESALEDQRIQAKRFFSAATVDPPQRFESNGTPVACSSPATGSGSLGAAPRAPRTRSPATHTWP